MLEQVTRSETRLSEVWSAEISKVSVDRRVEIDLALIDEHHHAPPAKVVDKTLVTEARSRSSTRASVQPVSLSYGNRVPLGYGVSSLQADLGQPERSVVDDLAVLRDDKHSTRSQFVDPA